ncbi:MAG TPA: metalloregulator ArsR/SmtB family transcription factor [Acidimicrobiales bacterium]|nr:metalloregulator ArsR/SmtB family transcription factor [Acidimicrobiales bacterium]
MADRPIDAVFMALSDPTRRAVLRRLADGPASPTELAGGLPVSRQAVSKHLEVLREAGLVEGARAGRQHRYRLTPEPMDDAAEWMAEVGGRWDRRLAELRKQFEE